MSDHFHVHIVNSNYNGLTGMAVAQAHLLDDIIALVCNSFTFSSVVFSSSGLSRFDSSSLSQRVQQHPQYSSV